MSKIFTVLVGLAVIVFVGFALVGAIPKNEIVECNKLKSYSEYPSFYLTEWQNEMCISHGIEIDAPVGNPYEKQKTNGYNDDSYLDSDLYISS